MVLTFCNLACIHCHLASRFSTAQLPYEARPESKSRSKGAAGGGKEAGKGDYGAGHCWAIGPFESTGYSLIRPQSAMVRSFSFQSVPLLHSTATRSAWILAPPAAGGPELLCSGDCGGGDKPRRSQETPRGSRNEKPASCCADRDSATLGPGASCAADSCGDRISARRNCVVSHGKGMPELDSKCWPITCFALVM